MYATNPCSDMPTIIWKGVFSFSTFPNFSCFARLSQFHRKLIKLELEKRLNDLIKELNLISADSAFLFSRLETFAIRDIEEKVIEFQQAKNSSKIQGIIFLSKIIWKKLEGSLRNLPLLQEFQALPGKSDTLAWSHICNASCLIEECLSNQEKYQSVISLIKFLEFSFSKVKDNAPSQKEIVKFSIHEKGHLTVSVISQENSEQVRTLGLGIDVFTRCRTKRDKFTFVCELIHDVITTLFPNREKAPFL